MALGVLEDKVLEHVPGTTYILDDASRTAVVSERDTHSKRTKNGAFILVPQPSDSAEDPLVRKTATCEAFIMGLTVG